MTTVAEAARAMTDADLAESWKRARAPLVFNVDRNVIAANRKRGTALPPISVRRGRHGRADVGSVVEFEGRGHFVYDPEHPLPCGATLWMELDGRVIAIDGKEP